MKTSTRESSNESSVKNKPAALSVRKTNVPAGIHHPLIDSGSRIAAQAKLHKKLFGKMAQRQEDELLQGKSAAQNGNRYSQHLVESMNVQAKLTVSAPNDVYEQEADKISDVVTRAASFQVQRQPEEEEELQMQLAKSQPATVSENLENRIKAAQGSGHSLPDVVQKPMGRAFGADFSGVRVHSDSEADALNRELSAKAFTTGGDIFFRQGEYSPGSEAGKRLLAHELTHVVQQSPGLVNGGGSRPIREREGGKKLQKKCGGNLPGDLASIWLYHATWFKTAKSIKNSGLQPMTSSADEGTKRYLCLSRNPDAAAAKPWAGRGVQVILLRVQGSALQPDMASDLHTWTKGATEVRTHLTIAPDLLRWEVKTAKDKNWKEMNELPDEWSATKEMT